MSGYVMGLILKYSLSRGSGRLTELVIGDCCHDDATGAYPSIRTIAARAGISERTAQRCIKHLEQLGELRVRKNAGPHRSNLYEIRIDRLLANSDGDKSARVSKRQGDKSAGASELHPDKHGVEGCQDAPVDGDRIVAEGDTAMAPDPSSGSVLSDPSEDPSHGASGSKQKKYRKDFEKWWRDYPKHSGKAEALKAWLKLNQAEKDAATADVPLRAAANWAGWQRKYIPRASSYINQRTWEDDIERNDTIVSPAAQATPRLSPGMENIKAIGEKWRREDGKRRDAAPGGQAQGQLVSAANR